uniref:Protein Wnt n=1 Tax=Timema monikensis TaxID=170555 RepID=A0A7R9HV11_9NEOP|nr:unnamed protein product [Timema monikensis]
MLTCLFDSVNSSVSMHTYNQVGIQIPSRSTEGRMQELIGGGTLGILGTRGRLCNRTSLGLDGCRLLCCGRGYQTRVRDVEEKCRCRFVWCCNVVCERCRYKKEEHICN